MSLEWPGAPLGGSGQSSLSPSQEGPNDGHQEDAVLAPGGAMFFNHLKYNEVVWIGTQVSKILKAVLDVSPGTQEEGLLDLRLLHKLPGNKYNYFSRRT